MAHRNATPGLSNIQKKPEHADEKGEPFFTTASKAECPASGLKEIFLHWFSPVASLAVSTERLLDADPAISFSLLRKNPSGKALI